MTFQDTILGCPGPEGYAGKSRGQKPRGRLNTMLALCYLGGERAFGAGFSWKRIKVIWDDEGVFPDVLERRV